jgi:hypothetical protein
VPRATAIIAASLIGGIAMFVLIRQQTAISGRQFRRSMIPPPFGRHPDVRGRIDPRCEIRELCKRIITGQQAEIEPRLHALDSGR